jgi:hypothetical protein
MKLSYITLLFKDFKSITSTTSSLYVHYIINVIQLPRDFIIGYLILLLYLYTKEIHLFS